MYLHFYKKTNTRYDRLTIFNDIGVWLDVTWRTWSNGRDEVLSNLAVWLFLGRCVEGWARCHAQTPLKSLLTLGTCLYFEPRRLKIPVIKTDPNLDICRVNRADYVNLMFGSCSEPLRTSSYCQGCECEIWDKVHRCIKIITMIQIII